MFQINFNEVNLPGAPGSKFITDAPGPGEEIENDNLFKINPVIKDVKKAFAGKIGCRPGFKTRGRNNSSPFVCTSYYSQFVTAKRLRNLCSSISLKT